MTFSDIRPVSAILQAWRDYCTKNKADKILQMYVNAHLGSVDLTSRYHHKRLLSICFAVWKKHTMYVTTVDLYVNIQPGPLHKPIYSIGFQYSVICLRNGKKQ